MRGLKPLIFIRHNNLVTVTQNTDCPVRIFIGEKKIYMIGVR